MNGPRRQASAERHREDQLEAGARHAEELAALQAQLRDAAASVERREAAEAEAAQLRASLEALQADAAQTRR